jgi:universal stress protein A
MASSVARDYDARLILLHVVPPLYLTNAGMPGLSHGPPSRPGPRDEGFSWPQPADACLPVEHRVAEDDDIAEAILRLAREVRCDLIVMSTQGRSGVARVLMGSIAEDVLRRSPCPVLVVKAPS